MPRPPGATLGRMENVNTNPKDGPAARYGYWASISGSAAARPLRRACHGALWWAPMQCKGMHCQSGSSHQWHGPRGPQGPLGIPPGHPCRWLSLDTFLHFFLGPCTGGVPAPEGQNSDFRRSGRNQGSMGLERCGPGPSNGSFGRSHSRFGRARYSNSDPRLDPPKKGNLAHLNGGQNSSIAHDQTGYGSIQRVHSGALDRTFQAPYSPGSALSVGNHCFGPQAQVPPLWAKKKFQKGAKSKPATGMAGRDAKGALGTTGAMG